LNIPPQPPLGYATTGHEALVEARARAEQSDTKLAAEGARADRAIAAFEQLAERLEAMAAERRPWWRRMMG
jgi:hypothetical protein